MALLASITTISGPRTLLTTLTLWFPLLLPLLLLLITSCSAQVTDIESNTIRSFPHVKDLRSCAKRAIYRIDDFLGCRVNSCICRDDLTATAKDKMLSFLSTSCDKTVNTIDYNDAVSLYDAYCSDYHDRAAGVPSSNPALGPTTAPASTPSAGGSSAGASSAGGVVTETRAVQSSPTAAATVTVNSQGNAGMRRAELGQDWALYLFALVGGLAFVGMIVI